MRARLVLAGLLAGVALAPAGCAHLPSYQRTALMTRVMQDPFDPAEESAYAQVYAIRETLTGASTTTGASCGCR